MKDLILVVDDNELNLRLCTGILSIKGDYDVVTAKNGFECLDYLNENEDKPALILLDIMMPEMNGIELATKIKDDSRLKNIPIIFLTAVDDTKSKQLAFDLAAEDYITKPFNSEELLMRVRSKLTKSKEYVEVSEQLRITFSFLRNILSHEIVTPINVLTGYNQLIKATIGEVRSKVEAQGEVEKVDIKKDEMIDCISDIEYNLKKQKESIERLPEIAYSISKAIFDDAEIGILTTKAKTNLNMIVKNVLKRYKIKNAIFKFDIDSIPDVPLYCDGQKIEDVIIIFLDNAIMHNNSEEKVFGLDAEVRGDKVVVSVEDNGPGINSSEYKNVFKPFYMLHKTTHHKKGLGLGLKIAKDIIDAHGGNIWIESDVGKGSTFHFALKIYEDGDEIVDDKDDET